MNAFVSSDSRGQWFVIADADDLDEATVSGAWIKTTDAVEARP